MLYTVRGGYTSYFKTATINSLHSSGKAFNQILQPGCYILLCSVDTQMDGQMDEWMDDLKEFKSVQITVMVRHGDIKAMIDTITYRAAS